MGSNCFSRGSVPEFLRKPIASSDFPGGLDPISAHLDMPMPNILTNNRLHKGEQ